MSSYTDALKINVNKLNAEEAPIILIEISHPMISEIIRIVQDNKDVVSNGFTYNAVSFQLQRQSDIQGELPKVTLTVQNVGRSLVRWIDMSGGGKQAVVTSKIIRRSDPDVVEEAITLGIERTTVTTMSIVFSLVVYNNLVRRGIKYIFNNKTAPGLF